MIYDENSLVDITDNNGRTVTIQEADRFFPGSLELYDDISEVGIISGGSDDDDEYYLDNKTIIYAPYYMLINGGSLFKPRPSFFSVLLSNGEEHLFSFGKDDISYDFDDLLRYAVKDEEIKILMEMARPMKQLEGLEEEIWSFEYDHEDIEDGSIMKYLDENFPIAQIRNYFIEEMDYEDDEDLKFSELDDYADNEDRMTIMLDIFRWLAEKNKECYEKRLDYFLKLKEKYEE